MESFAEFLNASDFMTSENYSNVYAMANETLQNATSQPEDFKTWIMNVILQKGSKGGFLQAFLAALAMVLVSELGDKTFFIAAIMAMKHSRVVIFAGALSALVLMTILSAAFGWLATMIPRVYTYYASAVLFAIFGIKMLIEGIRMKPDEGAVELNEIQTDLKRQEDAEEREEIEGMLESYKIKIQEDKHRKRKDMMKILLQAGTLTFLAEWGDRSQLATVVLAAREHAAGVVLGGCLGHAMCTGLAVVGGRLLAQRISVKKVTILGGILFLIFALSAVFIDPGSS